MKKFIIIIDIIYVTKSLNSSIQNLIIDENESTNKLVTISNNSFSLLKNFRFSRNIALG